MARYLRVFIDKDVTTSEYIDYRILDPSLELVPNHIINFPKKGHDRLFKVYKIVQVEEDTYVWCYNQPIIDVTKAVEG